MKVPEGMALRNDETGVVYRLKPDGDLVTDPKPTRGQFFPGWNIPAAEASERIEARFPAVNVAIWDSPPRGHSWIPDPGTEGGAS